MKNEFPVFGAHVVAMSHRESALYGPCNASMSPTFLTFQRPLSVIDDIPPSWTVFGVKLATNGTFGYLHLFVVLYRPYGKMSSSKGQKERITKIKLVLKHAAI